MNGPLPKSHLKFSYWALQGYFFCRSDNFANKMNTYLRACPKFVNFSCLYNAQPIFGRYPVG